MSGAFASTADSASVTTSAVGSDGSVTITTTTWGADGQATEHVTTTDANGNVISDVTRDGSVDPGSYRNVPGDADSIFTPAPADTTGAAPSDTGSTDTGSTDTTSNHEPSTDTPTGDEHGGDVGNDHGGDAGMDWDGADEGPPQVMPSHSASIVNFLDDPSRDTDPESPDPVGDRVANGLKHSVAVIPTSGGDTGQGDSAGSESLSDKKFAPATILSGMHVPGPIDGWGDWTDPRAHLAYAAAVLDAVAHAGATTLASVNDAAQAVAHLSAILERTG